MTGHAMTDPQPYADLTPEAVLDALEAAGYAV
jgi:hypothetical protein